MQRLYEKRVNVIITFTLQYYLSIKVAFPAGKIFSDERSAPVIFFTLEGFSNVSSKCSIIV